MPIPSVRLGELCDLLNGVAFKSDDYIDFSNTLVCRMSNIRPDATFNILYNPKYLPDTYANKYKDYLLKDGDIIIAMTDMASDSKILGVPTIVDTKGFNLLLNQRVGKLCKINFNKAHVPYLKKVLSRPELKSYYKRFSGGGLQLNISKSDILNIRIPLPSIDDQIRIAEVLTRAEKLIAKRKESISALDEFLKSTFLEMFGDPVRNEKGWEKKYLKSLTKKIGSGATPIGGDSSYKTEGISLIRSMNVYDNMFKYKDLAHIDEVQAEKLKNVIVEMDDVLLNITGASVCRCTLVPKDILPARVNQHVAIIRVKGNDLNSIFLSSLFTSNSYKQQLLKIAKQNGATREALTKDQIENLEILLPPLPIQNKFAAIVEKVEAMKVKYNESLVEMEKLYGSLSQRAFRGEL